MAGPGNDKGSSSMGCSYDPPPLSITLKKLEDLPKKMKRWSTDHCPVDILLLTVEDCEFLACYYYLRDSFKSYEKSIGYVYFGKMGEDEDEDETLKVALVKCSKESSDPGGSQTAARNAVTLLRPKAAFLVGFCYSPSPGKAQLGDVVLSLKLTTDCHQTPVSRDVANLVRSAAHGWKAPLENLKACKVTVHCDGEILSCSDLIGAKQQCQSHPGAIAVEMGGKGLFAAAHDMNMEWLLVKGVCDFLNGSGSTDDSWKTFACAMAASVVSNILSNSFVFGEWPHYGDITAGEESRKSDDPSDNKRRRLADTSENNQASTVVTPGEDNKMLPAEDTSENNQVSIVVPPGENIEMLPAEESSIVKKCQEQLKSYYDTFSKVKTVPWDDSNSVDIDEIYTPLYWVRDERTPSGVRQEELEDYTDMFKGNKYHRKPTRMLVYGRPGIGKSTFCKRAAYDWSKALKEILMNFCILLLIKLRDVCDIENIRDVLCASKLLAGDGPISVDGLYDYISKNQDKVLLIFDGYDEYSCAKEHSPILEIWKGELLRDCQVIVTTRQIKCDELRGPSHVQFEIHGFKSSKQIKTFARKFLKDEKDLKDFMSNLREKDLRDMAEIPLLLLMLCLVWNEKGHEGLPTSRADIYNSFILTMMNHRTAERSAKTEPVAETSLNDLKKDLSSIGKFAFESLLEEVLFIRCSKLPTEISSSLQNLLEVGLFQVVNIASLDPEKGIFFIHKSVQEFLAAWHMKEEVLSMKDESSRSLSKVDSFKKCLTMLEVLRFACGLSVETACAVFHHLVFVGRKESLSEFKFSEPPQSIEDLSNDQQQYLKLISHSYFCCSAEKRRDLYSTLLSLTGGILLLDSNQLNIVVNEQLLKCAVIPEVIFFSRQNRSSEKSHRNLITLAEHTDAVAVSCSGKKKAAANFLKKCPRRPLNEFFLKKEEKIILYVCQIRKEDRGTFPTEMLRELISSTAECTQEKRQGDPLNERDNETASRSTENTDSITGRTPHSLSCVTSIDIFKIERQELETLADLLPNCTSLQVFSIFNVSFRTHDAPLTETLVSRIIFTDRLVGLLLQNIKLTAKPAAVIARSLRQAPNLHILELSNNPLGEGVSVLTQHLSCVPHLETLRLVYVEMTKEQVNALSAAVRQSNIVLATHYHDEKGNVKPEKDWPTDEYWKEESSDDEQEVESVSDSDDERESGSVSDSDDEWESGSVSDSDDEKESGSVSDLNHE